MAPSNPQGVNGTRTSFNVSWVDAADAVVKLCLHRTRTPRPQHHLHRWDSITAPGPSQRPWPVGIGSEPTATGSPKMRRDAGAVLPPPGPTSPAQMPLTMPDWTPILAVIRLVFRDAASGAGPLAVGTRTRRRRSGTSGCGGQQLPRRVGPSNRAPTISDIEPSPQSTVDGLVCGSPPDS